METTLRTLQDKNVFCHASSSSVAAACAIPKKSVCLILKSSGLRTYRLLLHQAMIPADFQQRVNFAQWILSNGALLDDVLWSDEVYFSMDGMVNRHNCIIWAAENPRKVVTTSLHPAKLCVWMAFSANYKLKAFFFENTVDQDNYTNMLQHHMFPQVRRKRIMKSVIFHQDGAPPQFSIKARNFFNSQLPPK